MNRVADEYLLSTGGVWPYLSLIGGWSAKERDSEFIELIDLIRAIYIVDLEHVADLWNNWEGYERFVSNIMLGDGRRSGYVNRTLYLVQAHLAAMENEGQFLALAKMSKTVYEVVMAARKLAAERNPGEEYPFSRDLLFCACKQDQNISSLLEQSGLQLARLEAVIQKGKG